MNKEHGDADGRKVAEVTAPTEIGEAEQSFWMLLGFQTLVIVVAAASLAVLLRLLISRSPMQGGWTIQVLIALSTLVTSCWGAIQRRGTWERPTRRLIRLTSQAHRGEVPIEELSNVNGGITLLVPVIQDLLHEIKQQRNEIATLNEEMRARVAHRTDALERKIGFLQLQAMRDVLTGLYNRRALDTELPRVVESFRGGGPGACLLMIDVDNFKPLNDTLGHAAGDQLLKEIGQIIRCTIREDDLGFRYGGDEFVVLLHGCSSATGQSIATRLETLVKELTRPLHVAQLPQLSIGICSLDELKDPTAKSVLNAADERLYAVKAERKSARPQQKRAG
jgi:diguanylate cyclase (GGDEF)-like protein